MAEGEALAAPLLHRLDNAAEQVKLCAGIGGAVRVRLIGHGEVGEDALGVQAGQGAGAAYIRRAAVEMAAGDQVAQTGSSRVIP